MATSYDPLQLISIIEKTVLAQTEDQYPFAIVYEQELLLYGFHQNTMANNQWYERFNAKVDVRTSIVVTRQHSILLECTAQSTHRVSYQSITNDQRIEIQTDADKSYLAYICFKQGAKTSENLRTNLRYDYTTGENKYPKSCQATLHYLEKHSKSVVREPIAKEGTSFAKRKGNDNPDNFDKRYWKLKEYYKCGYTGHPESHCKTKLGCNGKKKKNKDDNSSSVSRKLSTNTMVGKMNKDLQNTKTSSAAVECMINNIESSRNSPFLKKHSKVVLRAPIAQEGSSFFSQRKSSGNPDTFDKKYLKDKECYKCGDKG